MRKALFSAFLIIFTTGLLHCSNSSGGDGATTYQVRLDPIHATWPIVREASGQWEIAGEGIFSNRGTETVAISTVALTVFNANGDMLTERTYGSGKFGDMIMVVLRSPNGNYTQISPSTSV